MKVIKPMSLLFRIYSNMYFGKYIHFGTIFSLHQSLADKVLLSLGAFYCNPLVRIEEFVSFNRKLSHAYPILKMILCDFHVYIEKNYIWLMLPNFIALIEEGVQSLNNMSMLKSMNIVKIYFLNF
jgi:hypothetical protein